MSTPGATTVLRLWGHTERSTTVRSTSIDTDLSPDQAVMGTLTEDELALVVGGDGDPIDPVGNAAGAVDVAMKATPILF
jgi:hypothetical protein